MAAWQIAALLFVGFGSLGLLLTISKQLDRLIREVNHLRIEHRNATGVEPAGMTLARERADERRWSGNESRS
ncbi:hypothetical protein [Brevundimonas sp.]|uniref:hypothetical protein n=1 Tax=Brevundimonas sp. TaxID=1871086 RepID=UPI0028A01C26|nr:hypothetical protein [Brevundimonas sp.]